MRGEAATQTRPVPSTHLVAAGGGAHGHGYATCIARKAPTPTLRPMNACHAHGSRPACPLTCPVTHPSPGVRLACLGGRSLRVPLAKAAAPGLPAPPHCALPPNTEHSCPWNGHPCAGPLNSCPSHCVPVHGATRPWAVCMQVAWVLLERCGLQPVGGEHHSAGVCVSPATS